MRIKFIISVIVAMALAREGVVRGADVSFDFTVPKAANTSAGIFSADGKLLRVLWTIQKLDAGRYTRTWDGKDDYGHDVPARDYHFKVAANRAIYRNVGAIGNSGLPPDPQHHTPASMLSVTVDSDGNIYSANGWDEAGADFKVWDKDGKSLFDAQYVMRNGHPNGAPYSIAVDDQYIYCGMGGWADPTWKEAQQIQRFYRKDGKEAKFSKANNADGHIQIYEWPSKRMPAGTPESQEELFKYPLRAVTIYDGTIFCADALGNRVLKFDKATGEPRGEMKVELPQALAVDAKGQLWVGHEHHLVTVYSMEGAKVAEPITDLGEIEAMSIGPKGDLAIADSTAGQVKIFAVTNNHAVLQSTLGVRAKVGDRDASHFFRIRGVAFSPDGGLATVQTEPIGGARVARWSADHRLFWEQFGTEFVSLGNYGAHDPDAFYSMTSHNFRLLDHNAGKWEYAGSGYAGPRQFYSDPHGVPRAIRFGNNTFFFMCTGDGVQVYRVDKGAFRLAALVGGRSPSPDGEKEGKQLGQWTWHDAVGDSDPKADQINWFKKPGEGRYSVFGVDVDAHGDIWFANTETQGIWTIPVGPLDARGNPTYDWKDAREVIHKDTTPLKFQPNMAQHADDGSVYAFGWSDQWPQPKNNPFWMGGTTLVRYDASGNRRWAVKLPALCVGLDSIPGGGGCMAGQGDGAKIHHFNADGLYIGMMSPGDAMSKQSGWLDNHASIAVNRDPRDKVLDIFAEDDLVLRIGWYRVNDSDIETIEGKISMR